MPAMSNITPSPTAGALVKRSRIWYIVAFFFGLGSIALYVALRFDDRVLAKRCLVIGLISFWVPPVLGHALDLWRF